MPKDIKLIGLDLDNTTLNSKKELTPRVAAAIKKAIEAGIVVLPATGRSLAGIPPQVMAVEGIRYALTSNGAMVYDLKEDRVLLRDCFSKPLAFSIEAQCQQLKVMASVFIDGKIYSEDMNADRLLGANDADTVAYLQASRIIVPSLKKVIEETGYDVEKFTMHFESREHRSEAKRAFMAREDCAVTASMANNLEINTLTANKGAALLHLGKLLGIPREQIMAVGDGANDLEMLKVVGYSVGMGNSHPMVLEIVDLVTGTAEEDGVAQAIESVLP